MNIRAVIWDIDGTLVDSEPLHLRVLLTTCAGHGINVSDLTDDKFVGMSNHGVWQALKDRFPSALTMQVWIDELNKSYVDQSDTLIPISQVKEVVTEMSRQGIVQAAVSNSNRPIVDVNLRVAGVAKFMAFTLSLDDVPVGKPSPIPYQMAAAELGLPLHEIIVVEDSVSGIQSAKAAGLVALGFSPGNKKLPMADRSIECLTGVLDFIHGSSESEQT